MIRCWAPYKALIYLVFYPDWAACGGHGAGDAVGHGLGVGALDHDLFDDGKVLVVAFCWVAENLLIMHLFIFLTFAQFKTLARSRLQAKTTTYIVFLKTFKRHAFSYC